MRKEMMDPEARKDFRFSYSFSCTQCGRCCRWPGHVLLKASDISRLAHALDLDEAEFIGRFTRLASNRRELALEDKADGSCVFLEGDRCRVYADRPGQCRTFPFAHTTAQECPGLKIDLVPRGLPG